ncbi:MAG TPA: thiamine-phosphate kinase [Gaiellales bacterium]|nr:thiamine-phosphate kinase [Gaiellales bacterium]
MLSEDDLVAVIAAVAGAGGSCVDVGIGDDAAVLAGGIVASTDILVDGVHFDLGRHTVPDIGHRAAAASLSDMAAMGAEPLCLLAVFGLPEGFEDVGALAAGMAEHGVPLSGGDLSRSDRLLVSVTAIGRAERPVLRSGGRPGDLLVVTGTLGGQAAGGYMARVTPRIAEGRALAAVATAMLDLSDGIATDAGRLAAASGTGAVVELERLPRAPGATVEQAAAGGEDYELLAAVPDGAELPVPVTVVGRLTGDAAVRLLDAEGRERPLRGWDHFA